MYHNSHQWKVASQSNPGFMCGKSVKKIVPFVASLGAKNGVPARDYLFQIVKLGEGDIYGSYSDRMFEACAKIGMKPVCDYKYYCDC